MILSRLGFYGLGGKMFIGRRPDGTVYGVFMARQVNDADHPGMEEVSDTHPDVIAFRNRRRPSQDIVPLETRLAALEAEVLRLRI